jgi:Domain of unknown function (DUF4174)
VVLHILWRNDADADGHRLACVVTSGTGQFARAKCLRLVDNKECVVVSRCSSTTKVEWVESKITMGKNRSARRFRSGALTLIVLLAGIVLGPAHAVATEIGDYQWERRPLLLFAPTDSDPRLAETLSRIEATRCDFVDRDMVIGVVVTEGKSTLDGQVIDADESQRLARQYAIGENTFSALLIGKDGGEKLRVNEVPDLQAIYAVVDGMPMRSREMSADPSRC